MRSWSLLLCAAAALAAPGGGQEPVTVPAGRKARLEMAPAAAAAVRFADGTEKVLTAGDGAVLWVLGDRLVMVAGGRIVGEALRGTGDAEVVPAGTVTLLPPVQFFDDLMREGDPRLAVAAGKWTIGAVGGADPFRLLARGPGTARFGEGTWADYYAAAAVRCPADGSRAGIMIGGLEFTIAAGAVELAGDAAVAGRRPAPVRPGDWYALKLACAGGRVGAWLDGNPCFEAATTAWHAGRPGLTASGAAAFDDLRAVELPVAPGGDPLAWAAADGRSFRTGTRDRATVPSTTRWVGGPCTWYERNGHFIARAPYFREAEVEVAPGAGRIAAIAILCDPDRPDATGYRAAFEGDGVDLSREGVPVLHRTMPADAAGAVLRFGCRDGRVYCRSGATEVFSQPAGELPAGTGVALAGRGWIDLGLVEVGSPRYFDHTFQRAPVDWNAPAGDWAVRSMWACMPQATWFAPDGRWPQRLSVLRFKRALGGDGFVEYSTAARMLDDQTPYYNYPWNMLMCLSPDPADPFAGLTVLFGGPDLGLRVFQAGRQVAADRLDSLRTGRGPRQPFWFIKKTLHEVWYKLAVQRSGGRVTVRLNDRPVLECDTGPTGRAYLFFAALDGGCMLGRVRVSTELGGACAAEPLPELVPGALVAAEQIVYAGLDELLASVRMLAGGIPVDLPNGAAAEWGRTWRSGYAELMGAAYQGSGFSDGPGFPDRMGGPDGVRVFYQGARDGSLRVVRPGVGGLGAFVLSEMPFRTAEFPVLRFDYRLPPGTGLGLMAWTVGAAQFYELHNGGWESDGILTADGAWHTAEIPLERLGVKDAVIRQLAFCDPNWQSGTRGTWYEIDNWALVPAIDPARAGTAGGVTWTCAAAEGATVLTGRAAGRAVKLPVIARPGFRPGLPVPPATGDPVVRIRYPATLVGGDFSEPDGYGETGNRGGLVVYARPGGPSVNGRILNVEQADFNNWENYLYLRRMPFSVDAFPLLTIRYRPVTAEWWLGCNLRNEVYGIFDDNNHLGRELKEDRAGCAPDGQWHVVTLDLRQALGRYCRLGEDPLIVQQLFLSGGSWGAAGCLRYEIDYYDVYSPRTDRVRAEWTPAEGAVFTWCADRNAATDPGDANRTAAAAADITGLTPGAWWFHLRTIDAGGGATVVHQPFTVE
ncbi:MAG: hypothetical protein ABIF71_11955 [Planctomycetota bacterium]